jgi:AraC-like DNA-binding protein
MGGDAGAPTRRPRRRGSVGTFEVGRGSSATYGRSEGLGERVARRLLGQNDAVPGSEDFDAFQFLLRASTSPIAAPIVSISLHSSFFAPLAVMVGGKEAPARAVLITAHVHGVTMLRFALTSPAPRILSGEPVTTVALDVGYDTVAAFSNVFSRSLDMPPSKHLHH